MIQQALELALDDAGPDIRGIAALALGRSGDEKAVPVLLDMAMNGPKDIEATEVTSSPSSATMTVRNSRSPHVLHSTAAGNSHPAQDEPDRFPSDRLGEGSSRHGRGEPD